MPRSKGGSKKGSRTGNTNGPILGEPAEPAQAPKKAVSDRKLAANRANATLSTGPRTAEGKAISSRNSYKHGCRAESVIASDEDPRQFEDFRLGLTECLDPVGGLECFLAERMVDLAWRLRRPARIEGFVLRFDYRNTPRDGEPIGHQFREGDTPDPATKIQRYETSLQRNFDRTSEHFERTKKARLEAEEFFRKRGERVDKPEKPDADKP